MERDRKTAYVAGLNANRLLSRRIRVAMGRTPAVGTSRVLLLLLWGVTSVFLIACRTPAGAEADVGYSLDGNTEIGISFPELQDERGREITAEHLPALGVETIRFDAPWHFREPERDTYNWSPMDRRMSFLEEHGIKAVLTFPADAPDWIREGLPENRQNPRSVALNEAGREEFTQYVGDFLTRYRIRTPGVIAYVQFGNEWASDYNYVGSGEEFAATQRVFYRTVKSVMPDTPVVLGGFSVGQVGGMALIDGRVDWVWDDDGTKLTVNDFTAEEIRAFEDRIAAVLDDGHYDWIDFHLYDQYCGLVRLLHGTETTSP